MPALPIVRSSLFMALIAGVTACYVGGVEEPSTYTVGLDQMNAKVMTDKGYHGGGLKIGIIDIGFLGMDKDPCMAHLFIGNQLISKKYFGRDTLNDFFKGKDTHGSDVASMICGKCPEDILYHGSLGRDSRLYLSLLQPALITEEDSKEDEMNIGKALQDLHDKGVRLVNISYGFWDDFKNKEDDYSPGQMDGSTTQIARICKEMAGKGMIIVNAAGNTAEYAWKRIWSPADVEKVITVGALSHKDCLFKAGYSGTGNPEVKFVKPDVVAYSKWGTSFSTPIITSFIAVMLQIDSTLTVEQVKSLLHRSSTLYPYPNNYVGYGVPDAVQLLKIMLDGNSGSSKVRVIHTQGNKVKLANPGKNGVVFHKTNEYIVRRQEMILARKGEFTVSRIKHTMRSTVVLGFDEVYEIFWE